MRYGYMTMSGNNFQTRAVLMGEQLPEWLQKVIIAIGGSGSAGAGIYGIYRLLKRDSRSDNLDEKSNGIIQNLERQLDCERTANAYLHEAIDRIAKERNDAVQNVGRLEGHVQALESQVSHLRDEVGLLRTANSNLVTENAKLISEIGSMRQEIRDMAALIAGKQQ